MGEDRDWQMIAEGRIGKLHLSGGGGTLDILVVYLDPEENQ